MCEDWQKLENGLMYLKGKLVVPDLEYIHRKILKDIHEHGH